MFREGVVGGVYESVDLVDLVSLDDHDTRCSRTTIIFSFDLLSAYFVSNNYPLCIWSS